MPPRAEDTWTTAFLHPEGAAPDGSPPGARVAQASRLAALGTLSAGLSHEMNDPLAAALAAQGLALEEIRALRASVASGAPCADLEPRFDGVVEALELARDGVRRTAQVVRGLALLGRPTVTGERVRVIDVVSEAVRLLPGAVSRPGTLRVQHGPAPDVTGSLLQLGQVVARLVANAFLALPTDGSGTVWITTAEGSAGTARIEIADDGLGMDAATAARALDPFLAWHEGGRGAGLGLPLCRSIAEACGGTLVPGSRPGRGTTMVVELPAAAA